MDFSGACFPSGFLRHFLLAFLDLPLFSFFNILNIGDLHHYSLSWAEVSGNRILFLPLEE